MSGTRQDIRKYIRDLCFNLTVEQKIKSANLLVKQSMNFSPILNAEHIALFLSSNGEINTYPLIDKLWQQNKKLYLPVLHPFSHENLLFLQYTRKTKLILNNLNILEPLLDVTKIATLDQIDIILVPLVAFDYQGQRLGRGKGFYDRTLKNWQQYDFLPIGIAYDCQLVNILPVSPWDIPLPIILTPSRIWKW